MSWLSSFLEAFRRAMSEAFSSREAFKTEADLLHEVAEGMDSEETRSILLEQSAA